MPRRFFTIRKNLRGHLDAPSPPAQRGLRSYVSGQDASNNVRVHYLMRLCQIITMVSFYPLASLVKKLFVGRQLVRIVAFNLISLKPELVSQLKFRKKVPWAFEEISNALL